MDAPQANSLQGKWRKTNLDIHEHIRTQFDVAVESWKVTEYMTNELNWPIFQWSTDDKEGMMKALAQHAPVDTSPSQTSYVSIEDSVAAFKQTFTLSVQAHIIDRMDVESSNEPNKCEVTRKAYICSPYSPKLDWSARADLKKIFQAQNAALKLEIEQKYPIAPWNQHERRFPRREEGPPADNHWSTDEDYQESWSENWRNDPDTPETNNSYGHWRGADQETKAEKWTRQTWDEAAKYGKENTEGQGSERWHRESSQSWW